MDAGHGENAVLKPLRWLLQGSLALVLLVIVLWTVSRLWPQSSEQREAVALMEQEPVQSGRNAFAQMWLLGYEGIDEDSREQLLAEDVARYREARAVLPADAYPTVVSFSSLADGRYPHVPPMESFCSWGTAGCLQKVRQDPARVAAELQGQQALLQRIAEISQYGHYQNVFPPDPTTPTPSFQLLTRSFPAHALAHVQGRSDEALQGICTDMRTARLLMSHGDSLIAAMIGTAMVEGNVRLLGEVLAELPLGHPLPESCHAALAPAAASELSACPAMRGEFAMSNAAITHHSVWPQSLLLDREKARGRIARHHAWPCTTDALAAVARDEPLRPAAIDSSVWELECAANAVGCVLADTAGPAYGNYPLRMQDAGAQLRLAAVLLWLREHAAGNAASVALARLPAALATGRPIRVSDDGQSLQLDRYAQKHGAIESMSISLPPGLATP